MLIERVINIGRWIHT